MFTGIVETQGIVAARADGKLVLTPRKALYRLAVGESVSVDGVCLTVDRLHGRQITFRLLPETVRISTLGHLKVGDRVNLERSLRVGDRLGGHLLLGHVDGQGKIFARFRKRNTFTLGIQTPAPLASCLVPKGPLGVDGVSLTLDPRMEPDRVWVHLIPHTSFVTTLGKKAIGSRVNLELDLIAKYLRGMLY